MLYASLTLISGEEDLLKFQLSKSATLRHAAHKYCISLLGLIRAVPIRPPHVKCNEGGLQQLHFKPAQQ